MSISNATTPVETVAGAAAQAGERTPKQSLQEYARGIAGGLLFSLPLIYTMEVWWAGITLSPQRLLLGLVCAYGLLLGYNRYAGLRADASLWEVAIDSVEELGLGLVIATGLLWLLGQIDGDMTLNEILGKVIIESMTVAIGVSVGTAQLGNNDNDDSGLASESSQHAAAYGQQEHASETQHFSGQLVIALCGAVLFAANIAPTEEIIQIAFETPLWRLLALAMLSLLLAGLILNFSNFRGSTGFSSTQGWMANLSSIVVTYAVGLLSSAAILWFFDRFDGLGFATGLAATIVLGVGATIGASAGRLLLQAGTS